MPYAALKWDHRVGRPTICWLVVKCASVGEKFGGPQALPPRRDIAYFVHEETAEEDAKEFAEFKNATDGIENSTVMSQYQDLLQSDLNAKQHAAFEWDHNIFNTLIHWAVLQWGGQGQYGADRQDIAYFLDIKTANIDARIFSLLRDRRLEVAQGQMKELHLV
ncbi:MAG: hypothetical protein HC866_21815 [Leptolyngbyaceae cyanobacterium RU_5_1]|nr:hypothetical protein [Leptolyngbyaceae cyanobacterium RU_5_1]